MLSERFASSFRQLEESNRGIVMGSGDWRELGKQSCEFRLVFPGSFNPLHSGHREMAKIAKTKFAETNGANPTQVNVLFEISISNVDKANLNPLEAVERLSQFSDPASVCFSTAKKFTDKSSLFPGAQFVIGFDTLKRLVDPKYYDGSIGARDYALDHIVAQECTLLVFGRVLEQVFCTLDELNLPRHLRTIASCVSEQEFRCDVSSTQLRNIDGA